MTLLTFALPDATILAIAIVFVFLGWFFAYLTAKRMLRRAVRRLDREFEERANALYLKLRSVGGTECSGKDQTRQGPSYQQRNDRCSRGASASPSTVPGVQDLSSKLVIAPSPAGAKAAGKVSPDDLVVITAAVTAFLGRKVRVHSARTVGVTEEFNAWAQQGRVFVQASHNLAQRGHS